MNSRPRRGAQALGWLGLFCVETGMHTCFKLGGDALGGDFWQATAGAARSPWVWAGLACYIGMFALWMTILKEADVGRAFPMTALVYVPIVGAAMLVFHERLNAPRVIGLAFVIAGVALLAGDRDRAPAPPV